jgi:hypothetical protein
MVDLEGKLSQFGDVVMYTKIEGYLSALNTALQTAKAVTLTTKKSYLSKYEITDDLRTRLGEDWRLAQPPGSTIPSSSFDTIIPLLSVDKSIVEIVTADIADYEKLADYLNDLANNVKGAFDPPLKESFEVSGSVVYPIPQSSEKDPRRGARLLVFEEFDKSVKDWLVDNALLYGFTLYQGYGLYYIGFIEVKQLATDDNKVIQLLNKFQSTPIPAGDIELKAVTVQKAEDPDKFVGSQSKADKNNPLGKTISANGVNANKVRATLEELGYKEKGIEIDNGGDITPELATAASAIFRKIKQLYPQYVITVSGGNDYFHHTLGYVSRHTLGNGMDFVISPSSEADLDNIVNILDGFSKGLNPYFRYIDEYRNLTSSGTGGHFHISWGVGSEGSATLAEAVANSPVEYTV